MTETLKQKLTGLRESYASPGQTKHILNTASCSAIIPSLAYAFPVVPCNQDQLNQWDNNIGGLIKYKFGLIKCRSTAMIRENREEFGLGCHSVAAKYHRRNAEALIYSLNNRKTRHKNATKALLTYQVESLKAEALELLAQHKPRSLPLRCSLAFTMRACQLLSIEISGTFIVKNSAPQYSEDLKWLSSLALSDHVTYNLENLVYVIARPLVALGIIFIAN